MNIFLREPGKRFLKKLGTIAGSRERILHKWQSPQAGLQAGLSCQCVSTEITP